VFHIIIEVIVLSKSVPQIEVAVLSNSVRTALATNNESSEVFDIIKPGRRVKIKGNRQ